MQWINHKLPDLNITLSVQCASLARSPLPFLAFEAAAAAWRTTVRRIAVRRRRWPLLRPPVRRRDGGLESTRCAQAASSKATEPPITHWTELAEAVWYLVLLSGTNKKLIMKTTYHCPDYIIKVSPRSVNLFTIWSVFLTDFFFHNIHSCTLYVCFYK